MFCKHTFIFFEGVEGPRINFVLRGTSFVTSSCFLIFLGATTFFSCFKSRGGIYTGASKIEMQAKLRFSSSFGFFASMLRP